MQRRWRGQPFHQSRACQVVSSISSPFFISRASINEREVWPLSAENVETELAENGETELSMALVAQKHSEEGLHPEAGKIKRCTVLIVVILK
ncbi:hypothetical protein YC2023_044423 [Brassica napus]